METRRCAKPSPEENVKPIICIVGNQFLLPGLSLFKKISILSKKRNDIRTIRSLRNYFSFDRIRNPPQPSGSGSISNPLLRRNWILGSKKESSSSGVYPEFKRSSSVQDHGRGCGEIELVLINVAVLYNSGYTVYIQLHVHYTNTLLRV